MTVLDSDGIAADARLPESVRAEAVRTAADESPRRLSLVFLGLSLTSSWGNGHATNFRALLKALAARGHDLLFLERDMPWYASNRDLPDPDFCRLSLYGDVEELAQRHGAALADADAVIVGSYVPDGVAVAQLALARCRGVVGFWDIDTPVTLAKLAAGDHEYLAPELIPQFDFYLSFTGGSALQVLRREHGARLACFFPCMVDAEAYRPTGETPEWDLGYLGTYSPDRQPALERLLLEPARRLPDRRFVVAGPQYPDDIDWPRNVDRIEHVPPAEHPSFYCRSRFTLNVTRAEMRATGWAPSVRLFEAAACGTAILSDRWEGLESFFPHGKALLIVDGPDEVAAALERADAEEAARLSRRAQQIVLSLHTGRRRALELEQTVAFAASAAALNA